ncbi:MAG: Pr6Pr family membrane protein [Rhodoluna sp.]|nr:Pr6Pr family membrane protein [Rhodoluna sp.]
MLKTSMGLGFLRIAMALVLFGSIFWQITDRVAHNLFRPTEYFTYFTITSCLLTGLALVLSGLRVLRNQEETKFLTLFRLTMAASMVIVGVIYNALLADAAPDPRDVGYDWPVLPNLLMHTYMPILVFLEWLLTRTAVPLKLKSAFWVLVYPLSWLAFAITRGFITGWWAYWFIDPQYGFATMAQWILTIAAFFVVLAVGLLPAQKAIAKLGK